MHILNIFGCLYLLYMSKFPNYYNSVMILKCTGVADQGVLVIVQLVNGGTQTVQGDKVEVPRVPLRRNQPCSTCTGVEAALQTDHGDFWCVACYANKKDWMVQPCNHVWFCFKCTTENIHHLHGHCPMCREMISGVERVYLYTCTCILNIFGCLYLLCMSNLTRVCTVVH